MDITVEQLKCHFETTADLIRHTWEQFKSTASSSQISPHQHSLTLALCVSESQCQATNNKKLHRHVIKIPTEQF